MFLKARTGVLQNADHLRTGKAKLTGVGGAVSSYHTGLPAGLPDHIRRKARRNLSSYLSTPSPPPGHWITGTVDCQRTMREGKRGEDRQCVNPLVVGSPAANTRKLISRLMYQYFCDQINDLQWDRVSSWL